MLNFHSNVSLTRMWERTDLLPAFITSNNTMAFILKLLFAFGVRNMLVCFLQIADGSAGGECKSLHAPDEKMNECVHSRHTLGCYYLHLLCREY